MMNRTVEILAPAGNGTMLSAAVFSGADAVYLGMTGFNARQSAGNFTPQALREAVAFCHARGVRVHVALNTLVYAAELDDLARSIAAVAEAGADAIIVDDLATAQLARCIAPTLALHGSTQMSIHTPQGALELAELGYRRVILARELSLEEIRAVCEASPIECEVFVHGALCMAMSGQCMMSAFLGGRSGNRGACAGPCRLPFDATPRLRPGTPGKACHLSLKDMDHVPALRDLMQAGVASVKIEGRLRSPEYAAAAVAACRAAREGLPYDAALLRDIFSRSGFTDAYLTGHTGREMFGVRTEADAAATRAATPKARELFRRELPRVPVHFTATFAPPGVVLTAADEDDHAVTAAREAAPQPAARDQSEGIRKALGKTGGTPFVCASVTLPPEVPFVPGSVWNELRRDALEQLLAQRTVAVPHAVRPYTLPEFAPHARGGVPRLAARFETTDQLPADCADALGLLVFPIGQWERVPQPLRSKTLLELPRAAYGKAEQRLAEQLAACRDAGFAGVVANNLAQLRMAGPLPCYGGLGLNIANPLSAAEGAKLGLRGMLLQPEASVAAQAAIAPGVPTAALCYGHLPLMLTRACPLQNTRSCAGCNGKGSLRDRKGRDFPVRCSAPGTAGVRTVYNPVPLYMGDRLTELPVDWAVAAFTLETPDRVRQILAMLQARQPFDSEFTRGLYYTSN